MQAQSTQDAQDFDLRRMAAEIVSAYVSANSVPAGRVAELIRTVVNALASVQKGEPVPEAEAPKPRVPIRRSVTPEYLVCLEDGKKLKMLKRHLRTAFNMSPDDYRKKWGLPPDYPMVAPNYAARRAEFAKRIGLGRGAAEPGRIKRAER